MKKTRVVKDESGTVDLCETYSTRKHKLLQVETDIVYGASVIDIIAGYDENNNPYSRYTYEETEEIDPDVEVV